MHDAQAEERTTYVLCDDDASLLLEITEEYRWNNSDPVRMPIRKEIASWRAAAEFESAVSNPRGAAAPSAWGRIHSNEGGEVPLVKCLAHEQTAPL